MTIKPLAGASFPVLGGGSCCESDCEPGCC